jgi:hypothetical protein
MIWTNQAQDLDRWLALVSAVMKLQVPQNTRNFLTSSEPVSLTGRTLFHGVSFHTDQPRGLVVRVSDY